jgi:hypothetical protein
MSKPFATDQIRLHLVDILQQAVDPSAGGGVAAAIGSMLLRSGTGQIWLKTGGAATAWQQLQQSLDWTSVKDFGAVGDGIADDTASIAAAIASRAAKTGGGVVFFPPGTYLCSQIDLNATSGIHFYGSGPSSIIKWSFNAATVAGSMFTIRGGAQKLRFQMLRFDGSGLTNPAASRDNHLVRVGNGATGAVEIQFFQCQFGGMVASSGDGIHVVGAAGNLISKLWISDCVFDGCSRSSVRCEQGWEYGWIQGNFMTNCETEIAFVSTASLASNAILIIGNEIVHTGAVRHALRIEGDGTNVITRMTCAENTIVGGFVTFNNVTWGIIRSNIITSGAFASADPVMRIFGALLQWSCLSNIIDRDPGASSGPCLTVEKATGTPTQGRVGSNLLINEKNGQFIKIVDVTRCSFGDNVGRATAAGASTDYGIDVQAITVAATDLLIGPGNQVTAAAGSFAGGVHLLANGANVTDVSVVGNQGDTMDYGIVFEVGGGGGTFNGQLLYAGNNFDSTTGDINNVGVTVRPRIGFNASLIGPNLFSGAGSPEGVITARISSMYLRTDGGQATSVYYKESGTGNTGWIGIGGAPIPFGTSDTTAVATAVFLAPGWITTAIATEIQMQLTRPATLRNFYVQAATAGTTAATNTYTVRKNGADTTITAALGNTATGSASDLTHSVTVVAGDLLSIDVVKSGAVATGQANVTATIEMI